MTGFCWRTIRSICIIFVGAGVLSIGFAAPLSALNGVWQQAYKVRSRMVAGGPTARDVKTRLAFVEIELEPGWKTYWRHPGDGGGIPPEFTWNGSTNLAKAHVLYPAPQRLKDPVGDTVGYKTRVIFPVELKAKSATQDIGVNLMLKFGICKDICVPTEATFKLTVPPKGTASLSSHITASLDAVPRQGTGLKADDPILQTVGQPKKKGDMWVVALHSQHAPDATDADLFLEAPKGLFVPLPVRAKGRSGEAHAVFELSLSDSEYQDLKGQTLTATVVDSRGASQSGFVLQ